MDPIPVMLSPHALNVVMHALQLQASATQNALNEIQGHIQTWQARQLAAQQVAQQPPQDPSA
jgi:hypothetical protein